MKDSILVDELPHQKALAFERRFGFVLLHIEQVTRQNDLDFIDSIGRQIQAVGR